MHAISEHTRFVLERDRWEAELARSERRQEQRERPQTQAPQVELDARNRGRNSTSLSKLPAR
jgi:hypothetical protein